MLGCPVRLRTSKAWNTGDLCNEKRQAEILDLNFNWRPIPAGDLEESVEFLVDVLDIFKGRERDILDLLASSARPRRSKAWTA